MNLLLRAVLSRRPVLMAAVVFLFSSGSPRAHAGPPAWGTIPSPNGGFGPNELFDVDVLSETDIWAVGNYGDFLYPSPQVQHWDGVNWRVIPLPEGTDGDLLGVVAVAANDVWFVGGAATGGQSLIFHWDGTAITRVTNPNPGGYNRLYDVTALSATDIWAVGEYANGGVTQTLIEHWDGTAWSLVPSPTVAGNYTTLLGVAAVAPNDIWAVGEAGSETFTVHWNGSAWRQVRSPTTGFSSFKDVSATPSGEVWAVGDSTNGTLTARWTGSRWRVVPSPAPGPFFNDLNGVVVLAANDVWAVGFYDVQGDWKTLALHYDGTQWTQVESPSPDPTLNVFNGIDADGLSNLWAVGEGEGTLTARWSGTAFDAVPSDNAGTGQNELKSLSAAAPNDIWAVGSAQFDSLAMHWDGTTWTIVPTPDLPLDAPLEGVAALASNDVWAVGFQNDPGSLNSSNVILRWNGSAWSAVPSPNPGGNSVDKLYDVAGAAANDVWAVGEHWDRSLNQLATILHWNGANWSVVENDCGGPLFGITVLAPNDIWAVGWQSCHYDGTTWNAIPIPPSGGADTLLDVSARATDDVWAVGNSVFCFPKFCTSSSYAIHWDGSQWEATPVPGASLGGVQVLGLNKVLAVGTYSIGTLITRWNGSSWRTVPSPDPESGGALNEVIATPGKLWAVGSFFNQDNELRTLVLDAPSATQGAVVGDTQVGGAVVSWFGPTTGSTTADEFGNYAAAGLAAGSYTFVASASGCDPDIATVDVIAGTTVRQNFEINCAR
jgi:Carboxypeptidase regulatory-like domain